MQIYFYYSVINKFNVATHLEGKEEMNKQWLMRMTKVKVTYYINY